MRYLFVLISFLCSSVLLALPHRNRQKALSAIEKCTKEYEYEDADIIYLWSYVHYRNEIVSCVCNLLRIQDFYALYASFDDESGDLTGAIMESFLKQNISDDADLAGRNDNPLSIYVTEMKSLTSVFKSLSSINLSHITLSQASFELMIRSIANESAIESVILDAIQCSDATLRWS